MKVIFFDIDGTLCNFRREIPESAIRGIRMAKEKGNIVSICTGRSESQIDDYILDIGFDAIVSAAGARVSVNDEVIYEHTIEENEYKKCLDVLVPVVPNLCVQTNDYVYVWEDAYDRLVEVFAEIPGEEGDPADTIGKLKKVASLYDIKKAQKMFYHKATLTVEEIQEKIGDYFLDTQMSFGIADPYSGEVTVRGIEKSTGMDKLMRHFGLSATDSVAFGDGPNDADMMQYAGISVCMGNGWEEIKKLASYVTADVDDDGIYRGLLHFGLI